MVHVWCDLRVRQLADAATLALKRAVPDEAGCFEQTSGRSVCTVSHSVEKALTPGLAAVTLRDLGGQSIPDYFKSSPTALILGA